MKKVMLAMMIAYGVMLTGCGSDEGSNNADVTNEVNASSDTNTSALESQIEKAKEESAAADSNLSDKLQALEDELKDVNPVVVNINNNYGSDAPEGTIGNPKPLWEGNYHFTEGQHVWMETFANHNCTARMKFGIKISNFNIEDEDLNTVYPKQVYDREGMPIDGLLQFDINTTWLRLDFFTDSNGTMTAVGDCIESPSLDNY